MSNIKIVCRKDKYDYENKIDYNKNKTETKLGDELIIEVNQNFMDTEKFFKTVKDSLEKYFNTIEKKIETKK